MRKEFNLLLAGALFITGCTEIHKSTRDLLIDQATQTAVRGLTPTGVPEPTPTNWFITPTPTPSETPVERVLPEKPSTGEINGFGIIYIAETPTPEAGK